MTDRPFPQQPQLYTTAEHRAAVLTYPANLRAALRQAQKDPKKTLLGAAQGIPSVFVTKVRPFSSLEGCQLTVTAGHGLGKARLYLDGRRTRRL